MLTIESRLALVSVPTARKHWTTLPATAPGLTIVMHATRVPLVVSVLMIPVAR